MKFNGPSLRDRLRVGTRTAQDALDRAQRSFDLSHASHRVAFLAAQRDALRALEAAGPELHGPLMAAQEHLRADLDELGHDGPVGTFARLPDDDATARGYVWHSQQLALRMLARRVPDGTPRGMRFLSAPRDAAAWRSLCDVLEGMSGYGAAGDAALGSANDWLALFETIHLEHARHRG